MYKLMAKNCGNCFSTRFKNIQQVYDWLLFQKDSRFVMIKIVHEPSGIEFGDDYIEKLLSFLEATFITDRVKSGI